GGTPGTMAGAGASGAGTSSAAGRPGVMPMGMMGAAGAGQQDRRGHTPAGYLVNATNTSELLGPPRKVSPAVLGRREPQPDGPEKPGESDRS
ncbi:MAG: hypothetical protein Q4G40_11545, partial [Brachybacterium sp.]|nr:hypothetical protein [Brachybacterium sp.]